MAEYDGVNTSGLSLDARKRTHKDAALAFSEAELPKTGFFEDEAYTIPWDELAELPPIPCEIC